MKVAQQENEVRERRAQEQKLTQTHSSDVRSIFVKEIFIFSIFFLLCSDAFEAFSRFYFYCMLLSLGFLPISLYAYVWKTFFHEQHQYINKNKILFANETNRLPVMRKTSINSVGRYKIKMTSLKKLIKRFYLCLI